MQESDGRDAAFAQGIRAARERLGKSQQWVADQMSRFAYEWHQTTVYKAEAGTRKVTVGEASALAEVLRAELPDLLNDGTSDERTLLYAIWTASDELVSGLKAAEAAAHVAQAQRTALKTAAEQYDALFPSPEDETTATARVHGLLSLRSIDDFLLALGHELDSPEVAGLLPLDFEARRRTSNVPPDNG